MKLTICIPTLNNATTISLILDALSIQEAEFQVKIFDNGSKDGTKELVEAVIKNKFFPFPIELINIQPMAQGRAQNIPYQRYKMAQATETEFIMFLDSDVLLTPTAIKNLIADYKDGILGIRYNPNATHVQMGATLMRTEIAKKINWRIDELCECLNASKDILPLETKYHDWLQARHIKFI